MNEERENTWSLGVLSEGVGVVIADIAIVSVCELR